MNNMTAKQIFMTTIAISLAAHIAVVVLVGFLVNNGPTDGEDAFSVTLWNRPTGADEGQNNQKETEGGSAQKAHTSAKKDAVDTVNLDSTDTKYFSYLLQVKESIDDEWSYPDDAFTRGEVGSNVVEFSIAQEGTLAACRAVVSSGHESLDAESVRAVRAAAPFAPLSMEFELARLNIVAKFRYTLAE